MLGGTDRARPTQAQEEFFYRARTFDCDALVSKRSRVRTHSSYPCFQTSRCMIVTNLARMAGCIRSLQYEIPSRRYPHLMVLRWRFEYAMRDHDRDYDERPCRILAPVEGLDNDDDIWDAKTKNRRRSSSYILILGGGADGPLVSLGTKPSVKPKSFPILCSVSRVGFAFPVSISAICRFVTPVSSANFSWVSPSDFLISRTASGSLSSAVAARSRICWR